MFDPDTYEAVMAQESAISRVYEKLDNLREEIQQDWEHVFRIASDIKAVGDSCIRVIETDINYGLPFIENYVSFTNLGETY
jgi:hypothetical protein